MKYTGKLEIWIDEMVELYGMPSSFLIPGTSMDSAALHLARAVCRRVERLVVSPNRDTGTYGVLIIYFNRLSDLLFILAWTTAVIAAVAETVNELVDVS
jgi:cob(I)alamin adenosyltransferase